MYHIVPVKVVSAGKSGRGHSYRLPSPHHWSETEPGNGENPFGANRPGESARQSDSSYDNRGQNMTNGTFEAGNSDETANDSDNKDNPGITINGGNMFVSASGDGIDSNGFIIMTGGCLFVNGPTDNMNGAMDYDESFVMTGGTVIALGSAGMYQSISSDSTCGSINYLPDSSISAENTIKVYFSYENQENSF